jgi:G:T-mismatch repair DNA endonuclease (very short patch repair protein)/predicted nucleic acid-binding Zn ribbon protein
MKNLCNCGCGIPLRKDNKTGYQKGHKPCPVCGTLVKGSGIECCSKSCAAKLHWQRNPDMKESRIWNADRYATREKNRDTWTKKLSDSCKGRIPWNKNTQGLQTAWNKNLPANQQPFYGKTHSAEYYQKRDKTVFEKYGVACALELAKTSPRSKKEKLLENVLVGYQSNKRVGRYKPDYVNETTKHIVEVYGDYWHCNPTVFKEDFYHPQLKKTAREKWQLDSDRQTYLESLGYNVTVVWESKLEEFIKQYDNVH